MPNGTRICPVSLLPNLLKYSKFMKEYKKNILIFVKGFVMGIAEVVLVLVVLL